MLFKKRGWVLWPFFKGEGRDGALCFQKAVHRFPKPLLLFHIYYWYSRGADFPADIKR